MVTGLEQDRLLLLPLFILGLAFEFKGEGGGIILCEQVKKCSFSDDIHLMASLENHQRFLRENMTNKQKFRLRVQHIEYKEQRLRQFKELQITTLLLFFFSFVSCLIVVLFCLTKSRLLLQ